MKPRELWIVMPTPLSPATEQKLEALDRDRWRTAAYEVMPLTLELADETKKLLILRMVRRGGCANSDVLDELASFAFTVKKAAGCELCWSEPMDLYDPNCRGLDPAGQRLLSGQALSPRKLCQLVVVSSTIIVRGHWCPEFNGIHKNGRLIRCEGKGEPNEMTPSEQQHALHEAVTGQ